MAKFAQTSDWVWHATDYISDWLMCQKIANPLIPGYAACITVKGQVVLDKAYGLANIEKEEALTTDHLFRIASHSKTFTTVAILQLVDKNILDLDAPVKEYLAFLEKNPDKRIHGVTTRQLLSHTAGIIRDGKDASYWRLEKPFPSKKEIIEFFSEEPSVLKPGERFKYSNYAYGLLGILIEELSGLSYQDYLELNIFKPLELNKISTDYDSNTGSYVTGYSAPTPVSGQLPLACSSTAGQLSPAAGICTNGKNLCRFYNAILNGFEGLFSSDAAMKILLNAAHTIPDESLGRSYGYGLAHELISGFDVMGHAGTFPGQVTKTTHNVQEGITVCVLTNTYGAPIDNLHKGIWHILDFFQKNYASSILPEDIGGIYCDISGTNIMLPLGNRLYVSNPFSWEPFKDCAELASAQGTLTIIKDTGFGSYGEIVNIVRDDGKIKILDYAGYPKYKKEFYSNKSQELRNSMNL